MKTNVFKSNLKYKIMHGPLYFHWRDLSDDIETTKQKIKAETTKSN
jgi:hypothetical protein